MASRLVKNPISMSFPRSPLPKSVRPQNTKIDRDGRRVVGADRPMTAEEFEELQYQYDFDCRRFDMSVAEDVAAYKELQKFIINKRYLLRKRHDLVNNETGQVWVYLEWVDPYRELPEKIPM